MSHPRRVVRPFAVCVALAACGGGASAKGGSGGGGGGGGGGGDNLATFCLDQKSETQVFEALIAVEGAVASGAAPIGTTSFALTHAASSATRLAGEAPETGTGVFAKVQIQATMAAAAKTLNAAATKMANGDTSGHSVFPVNGDSQSLSDTYAAQINVLCEAQ